MFLIVNASRDSQSWPMVRGLKEGLDPPKYPTLPTASDQQPLSRREKRELLSGVTTRKKKLYQKKVWAGEMGTSESR